MQWSYGDMNCVQRIKFEVLDNELRELIEEIRDINFLDKCWDNDKLNSKKDLQFKKIVYNRCKLIY
jgi:hypothetical protein